MPLNSNILVNIYSKEFQQMFEKQPKNKYWNVEKKVFTRFKWSWNMLILSNMIAIDMQTLNNVYIWTIKCACVFQVYNVISRRINFGNECFRPNFWHWISLKIFIAESLKYIWLNFMFFKSEMVFQSFYSE